MKKLFVIFITIVLSMLLLSFCTSAASESDLTFELSSDGNFYSVSFCSRSAQGDLSIPATYKGKPVTSVADYAFKNCKSLTSVKIPDSITELGEEAFSQCTSLTNIALSNSLTVIEPLTFANCYSLTSIIIPDSVTSIEYDAFADTGITSIIIPENVISIGERVFFCCDSLTTVEISESVTIIGPYAFGDCSNLENIVVDVDNEYYSNDEYGVLFNKDKTSLVKCPSKKNINSYRIPDSVTNIEDAAFRWCSYLTKVTIPDSVTHIGDWTFSICQNLVSISIPVSVESIGSYAFADDILSHVYYDGTKTQWNKIIIGEYNEGLTDATIHFLGEDDIHTHSYTVASIVEPTCTTAGTTTYSCTCGDTYTETIPATNHPNATTDPGKVPTTTEPGYTAGKYCPDCKIWIEGHTEIPKLEEHKHSYAPTTTQEATCWREGVKTYTCSCGDTYTETIAKTEHVFRYVDVKKKATCTEPGLEWTFCDVCELEVEREIPAEGHNEYAYTRRATPAEAGAYVVACDKCWIEFSSVSFGRPAEYKLSTTTYTYNGKAKTPKLTITTSDGKVLKKGVDYTVELPKDRTSVGTHTYRVVFMGDYLGETKVSYQILPGKTSSVSASQSTDYIKLTWKKVSGATGYRVYQYNSSTGKYKTLKTLTGTSYTVKNLKAGTTYKFAVKAYTKANGETLWAASSKTLTTATKPATPTVKATAGSGKATLSWSKVTGATGYVVYMMDEFGDYVKVGSTKKTSYTVTDLDYGKTYNFRVKAYKTAGDKNVYSGHKTVKVTTLYPAVYVTPSGKRYHYDRECAGKNATKTTLANAKKTKTPCKTCVL